MDSQSPSPAFKKVHWTEAEDAILFDYVKKHGEGKWNAVAKATGLARCGKSCRNRWLNHLKPNLKKGPITPEEEQLIIQLQAKMGNKWAHIVKYLPGRTDNEIKNFWNCKMKRFKSHRVGVVPLPSPPPVLNPSKVYQQQQQDECSPWMGLSLPIVPVHGVPVPSVPDIVAQYFHPEAIGKVMENAVGMLQSRGIRIPNSLPRVPAPLSSPMMTTVNADPQAPWVSPWPMMPVANVDPLAPSSSPMVDTDNVDPQAPGVPPLPMMPMANVDPLAPQQLPIVSVLGDPTPSPPSLMSIVDVDPQAPSAPLPTMPMINVDPLAPQQLSIVGMDHPTLAPTPIVDVDPPLDLDFEFDFDIDFDKVQLSMESLLFRKGLLNR